MQARVWAGAWSQPRGGYYAKLSGIHYLSTEVFNDKGCRIPRGNEDIDNNDKDCPVLSDNDYNDDNQFRARQVLLYGEYGLIERLTLTGQVGAARLVSEDTFVESITWGLGDVHLGAKYQLTGGQITGGPLVLSSQVNVAFPSGYDRGYKPALGTGYSELGARLLAGLSLYPLPLYAGGEVGYKLRGGPWSNQVSYFVELGATPRPWLFAKGFVAGVDTRSKKKPEEIGLVGVEHVSEGDSTEVGFNASVQVAGPLWIDLLWKSVFKGKDIGAGSSLGLGLALIR